MAIVNRLPGRCNNPACPLHKNVRDGVDVGEGYITKVNDRWTTWCSRCVPEQKDSGRRVLTVDGKIITPYEPANVPLIKSLKGPNGSNWPKFINKDEGGPAWEVSLEQADRQRLLEVANALKLEIAPQLLEGNIVTEEAQNALDAGLYDFQVTGVNWMSKRQKALLADDMGLGKTIQTLVATPVSGRLLVVAPAGLKYNWKQEAARWRPDLKVSVIKGSKAFRFPAVGEIVVTSYDSLPDYLDPTPKAKGAKKAPKMKWPELKAWREALKPQHPDAEGVIVVFDEAHKVKNYKTERARKVRELSRLCSKVWGLTGTPLDNEPGDLFGILDSLDMSFEVFTPGKGQSPFKRFQQLFGLSLDGFGSSHYGHPDPIVPELLRRVMLRRKRTDVLPSLPRKTYSDLIVGEMDERIRRQLDEIWEEDGATLQDGRALPPFEKFSEIRAALAKNNIPAMLEFVENAEEQGVPLVVASSYLSPIDALLTRPGWAVITGATSPEKRQDIVNAFQAGRLKGVGVTIRAGGIGLNFTHAWKMLFVDMDWVPGWNAQMEDRICRIGQMSNKVEITRMVNDHPLTIHVLNRLAEKTALIEAAVEKSFTVKVPTGLLDNLPDTETEEEFQARLNQIPDEGAVRKARAKGKVGLIHQTEKARSTTPVLPLTPARQDAIRQHFARLLSSDTFRGQDSAVAQWLSATGLETEQEVEAAYFVLTRYADHPSK